MTEVFRYYGLSLGKIVAAAVTIVFLFFALLAFLQFGFIYAVYALVEEWVAVRLGFDYYFSNLAATVFTAIFSLLVPTLAWYIFLGRRKAWGIGTIIGIQLLICGAVYTIGSGVCFDRRTGKPLCYFADTPAGRVWSYTPGYDPASGKPFGIYTREFKEAEDSRRKIKSGR